MSDDTQKNIILMNPSEVCALLDIKESTLRKYAGILKNAGYDFHMNDKGQRGYFDKDVIVLRRFLEVKATSDMTLGQAANAVIAWVKQSDMSLRVTRENEIEVRYSNDINELKEIIERQNELLQLLMQKMDLQQESMKRQQEYIDKSLEERDEKLTESIRIGEETKQLLLESEAAKDEERTKSFWSRLFGK